MKKDEHYFLEKRLFILKTGKITAYEVLENGKVISSKIYFKQGEIIGNFFKFMEKEEKIISNLEIEIEALENTVLEELIVSKGDHIEYMIFEKIIDQFLNKSAIEIFKTLYDTKGYILSVLKSYANLDGELEKQEINFETFSISRSLYYLKIKELKREKYIKEKKNIWKLNLIKIDSYLNKYHETDI
ncbi:MAG: hypothetical protein ACRDDH_16930 [Cetobacterium sp.]|uniref:hypothetical protein n=1 Tax=Cetobacterium sp. TaxID=2071632 RepID=UPI003EE6E898